MPLQKLNKIIVIMKKEWIVGSSPSSSMAVNAVLFLQRWIGKSKQQVYILQKETWEYHKQWKMEIKIRFI